MQVPKNSRDLKLQNTSPRVLDIKSNYINLTCPTLQFKYGSDNIAQPASTIVTADLIGILQGTVTFTVTGLDPVPTTTNNQIAINPDHIVGDLVSVSASLVYQGITYTAVPITISKIFNQLVVKTSRSIDLLPSYTNGSGYTLPAADNFIELYNGTTKLDSGVEYGPANQTKNGLTATVNTSTGKITLSETAANTWTGTTDNFVFTAKRGSITYSTTYTITKAKQGVGGQQLAEVSLYQWATTQPAIPTGTGTYTWATLTHTYIPTVVNPDSWTTAVPANPGTVGIKLWKITKGVSAEASSTNTTAAIVWNSGYVITVVSTTSNSTIKTTQVIVYKNDTSIPTISGTSTYTWSSQSITANIPNGWTDTAPTPQQGFTLYAATVSITERVAEGSTSVNWSEASISPARYYGTDGAAGINAITADLTNGSHAIPTDSTGDTVNYANSGTDLFVYEGATALGFLTAAAYDAAVIANTANGKYKVTSASSTVTAGALAAVTVNSVVGARFADLTASSFAKTSTGSLTITVTGKRSNGASFTYLVTQTFSKTPSGIQGVAGVAYWLTTSSSVIQKNIANAYSPTTITVSGKQSSGSTVSNYSGWFKIFLNGSATATYTSEAAEATKTYTIAADTATVTIKLYTSSDFSVLLDEETVPVVSDGATGAAGANAITADLTNGSHAIPTDSTGDTVNYANSGTDLFVYEGATALGFLTAAAYDAAVIANTANGKYKVTSASSTVTAGALAAVTVDSVVGARFADLTASSFAKTSTGSLTITVTGKRSNGASFTYLVTQTFSKTPSGIQGVAGVAYWLTTSSSVIQKSIANAYSPTTITVSGKQSSGSTVSNYSGWFKIFLNGSATATYTSEAAEATKTYTIAADTATVTIKLYTSSDFSVLLDEETVPVVSDGATGATGANAITADLTNGSHAIPTDSTGDTVNYANSGTDLFVYEGATALGFLTAAAYDAAVIANTANGKYKVTSSSSTVTAGALAAVTINSVVGARFADLTASSFAKTSTGSLVITVTGKRSNGVSFSYILTQTFSKTPSGIQGVAGVAYWLTTSSSVIQKSIANAYSPTTITVSGKQSSGSTVSNYSGYFKIFLNGSATATYTSEAAEATKTYTIVADTTTIAIKLYTSSDFSVLLDEETVPVVSDGATGAAGANAITADLTNATHAIPTDSTGDTVNYANSGTDLFVYEGATALGFLTAAAYDAAVIANTANGKYKVTSSSSTVTAGALAAVTVDSVVGGRFADLTASSFAKTSTGSLVITVTGKRVSGTNFSYILTQTFSKTPSGIQGIAGVAYWLTTSSSVIKKNIASVYSPTTITVTGKQSSGSTVSNYSGYFKIFLNGSGTATYTSETAEAIKTYTIVADTTTISVKLYTSSDFSVLLDEETIPVVSDGATGSTGASARRAYVVATGTPSGTPIIFTATGDKLPISDDAVPVSTWFVGKTWLSAAPSTALEAGETLYQSDGVYVTGGNTVWGYPYISALKVGSLSAITVNTGGLTVSDYIKSGATSLTEGTGFYLNSSGYLRVGTAGGARVQYDSDGLSIYNASNTAILTTGGTLLWGAVGGSGRPADSATVGAIVGNNVYDSQSVVASLGRIFNNLLDPGKWTISSGSQPGFNQNGVTAENQVLAALAPDGAPSLIWKSVSNGGNNGDGGWDTDNFAFDHAKPYRFTTWIRMSGNTTGSVYLGVGGNTVKNLADSSINSNPYFFASQRSAFTANRWYLFVGYVWPSSFTGTDVAASKIYDSVTGEAIATGTDFKWDSASTVTSHRTYQYYTTAGAIQEFWAPRVDIIDGSETPITTLLAIAKSGLAASSASLAVSSASASAGSSAASATSSAASALASASSATAANDALQLVGGISWLGDATIRLVSGVRIIKDGTGATAGWNAHRYSVESYTGGAYISFQPASTSDFMIGLNTDPATNSSYDTIDYAWYCLANGTLYSYENGTGTNLGITYDTNTVLSITYDNQFVRYFKNGVIVRTVDTGSGSNLRFYIDSSLHSINAEIKSIRFGPNAAKGAVAGNLSITGNGTFRRTENLVISPSVMYLSATTQNFTSITSYTWKVNGAAITTSNSASTASGNTLTVSSADFTNNINRVYSVDVLGVLNGVDTTLTDSVTINRLDNGSSAITVDCSNENITFTSTASTGFTGISFTGGSSIFSVYKGSTQIEYGTGNNQWRMGTPEYTGVGYSVSGITIGNTWVQVAPNSMTQNNAYSTYSIIYKDPNGVETTYTKVITYSLARTGAASTVAGPRGSLHLYLSGYTTWDSTTKGAVNNTFTNVYGGKVINDMVTVYGTNFSQTRIYTGNTATGDEGWVTITVAIDGNLLVSGTVSAGAISTTNAFIGHKLQDADGLFVLDFYNKTLSITTT